MVNNLHRGGGYAIKSVFLPFCTYPVCAQDYRYYKSNGPISFKLGFTIGSINQSINQSEKD